MKTHAHYVLPEHLAFDEFKSTKDVEGAMSFIYCDSVTHDIIDILPDRRKHQLEAYFLKFSRKQREKVKNGLYRYVSTLYRSDSGFIS
nr:transposase [Staphylococcus pseudintermedius]